MPQDGEETTIFYFHIMQGSTRESPLAKLSQQPSEDVQRNRYKIKNKNETDRREPWAASGLSGGGSHFSVKPSGQIRHLLFHLPDKLVAFGFRPAAEPLVPEAHLALVDGRRLPGVHPEPGQALQQGTQLPRDGLIHQVSEEVFPLGQSPAGQPVQEAAHLLGRHVGQG